MQDYQEKRESYGNLRKPQTQAETGLMILFRMRLAEDRQFRKTGPLAEACGV